MTSDALVFQAPDLARSHGEPSTRRRRSATGAAALGWVGLLGLFVALGCATPFQSPSRGSAWIPTDELVEVDTQGRGLLLVRRDHQLGRYDNLLIEHVGFRYGKGQDWLSFREEARINALLTSVVQGSQDGAIGIADDAGPCVLSVRVYLTDLEIYDGDYASGSTTSFVNSFGEATLIMELRDSLSDTPLARFLQRRELGGGTASGGADASLRRLGTVVGVAMRDMGAQLQKITPPTVGGWDAHCDGEMARVALGSH